MGFASMHIFEFQINITKCSLVYEAMQKVHKKLKRQIRIIIDFSLQNIRFWSQTKIAITCPMFGFGHLLRNFVRKRNKFHINKINN